MQKVRQGQYRFTILMHLEQNNIAWMKVIVHKSTKPGYLVMDASARTIFFYNARLYFAKPRIVIGWKADSNSMTEEMKLLAVMCP